MERLGVYATPEEAEELKRLLVTAQETPVILIGDCDPSANAWERVQKRCHEVALAHGLPEFGGYYGIDLEHDNEFLKS